MYCKRLQLIFETLSLKVERYLRIDLFWFPVEGRTKTAVGCNVSSS